MFIRLGFFTAVFLIAGQVLALDCGGEDQPCEIVSGEYHIVLPDEWQGGSAVMYLHGYGGSGEKVVRNKGFVKQFTDRGYAVIAPTALPWHENKPNDWALRDGWPTYPRYDKAFLRDVLADVVTRADVAPDRLLLSGFSRGGSMVWEMACLLPEFAHGYAPASGGFYLPMTQDCAGPVHILHTHGFTDKPAPLEGRVWHNEEFDITMGQADIWEGLQLWRREDECLRKPTEYEVDDVFWRKRWDCTHGSVEIVLHNGGHTLPKGWANMVLDWFEGLNH